MTMPEQKKAVVPRLRFPEFRDAGPWEIRTIEDVAEKIAQGGTPDTTVPEFWNGDIPWITPAEMGDDALHHYTKQTVRALSTIGLQNSSAEILPAYSVIVSSRAPIGYVTINTVPMATNQGCKGIVPKQQIYHEFLYYSLLRAKRQLNDLGAGAGFKEISASSLKKLKILMPERAEQQKIADCLSSLDELIELQAKQLEALQAHKKGLMQQLFPREGETTPRLRFPEFRDAGPWEVKRLSDIARHETSSLTLNTLVLTDSGYPIYGANGCIGFIDSFEQEDKYIAMVKDGSGVGRLTIREGKSSVLSTLTYIKPREKSVLVTWLYYCLSALDLSCFIKGSGIPHIYFSDVGATKVGLPSLPEQQKIADCLSSLDELIELQAKQLEALQTHKKGLMQQLFPQEIDL